MKDANFPTDDEGRTYHVYLKPGEAAPRVITVGDLPRAVQFARLPGFEIKFVRQAPRFFTSITGLYNGVPVTIIASLMGFPNMDFAVRELRHVVQGPMAIIRVGTCGSPAETKVGDITVPSEFHICLRDPDHFGPGSEGSSLEQMYRVSKGIHCDSGLRKALFERVCVNCTGSKVIDGHNVSSCSFYSSQGRLDHNFNDRNQGLIDHLVRVVPQLVSIEMESGHLMDLASNCTQGIHAAACHIIVAQRRSQDFLSNSRKHEIET